MDGIRYKNNFISQEVYSFRFFGLKIRINFLVSICIIIILIGEERERKRERVVLNKVQLIIYLFY